MKNFARALCLTPACVELGAEYVKNLSPNYKTLDPCAGDFHEMVCGGFRERHTLEPGEPSLSMIDLLADKGMETVKAVIEGPYPGLSNHSNYSPQRLRTRDQDAAAVDEENFNLMKVAYTSCMNEKAIEEAGTQPITQLLEQLIATFPSSETRDWSDALVMLHQIGYSQIVRPEVYFTTDANLYVSVQVLLNSLLEGAKNFENATLVQEYTSVVGELLDKISPRKSQDTAKLADDVVQFEKRLMQVNMDRDYRNTTLDEMRNESGELRFDKIVTSLAPRDYNPQGARIEMPKSGVLANITKVLADTPKEIVESYLIVRAIVGTSRIVEAPAVFARLEKLRAAVSTNPNPIPPSAEPRSDFCIDFVQYGLGWILSRFFVEHAFSAHGKEVADAMIRSIRTVYVDRFKALDWMDDATKAEAIRKVELMEQLMGYPVKEPINLSDPFSLQRYYAGVNITTSYFANDLAFTAWATTRSWKALTNPVNELLSKQWPTYVLPTIVDAFYASRNNIMIFPAAILQSPFFHEDLPPAVNYGAFGAVAGHEVSHAFDTKGMTYDADGVQRNWWGNETLDEYNRRVSCFVNQFSNYTVKVPGSDMVPLKVDGNRTLAENLADSAGLVASHQAWAKSVEEAPGGLKNLPGLEGVFTPEQLFFVAYANVWCHKTTEKGLENEVKRSHAPSLVRAKGTLENSRAFKEAFGCKVREPTCELW
ncbi:hypothetical protein OQA88_2574 [Cercophora sp. LCS_1]